MRLLSRTIFREIFVSAFLGTVLFTFVLFLYRAGPLFEFLVRNSGSSSFTAYLFALVLPQALPFTIPLGVLVGTLITLSRMSSDGEITAMRAAGIPPMSTVVDPSKIESGGPTQVQRSPTLAAGRPPIITVTAPGGSTGPPVCGLPLPGFTNGQE
jgi:hypothetical protein